MSSITPSEPRQLTLDLPELSSEPPDSYWRSLYFFNGYRFVVALLLLVTIAVFGNTLLFGSLDFKLFAYVSAGYVMFSSICFLVIAWRRYFHLQLGAQVSADILFIVVLMFASGGISSGLGLLLLSGLAAAGLISRGRLTLFYAALATIAVLLEHTVQVLYFYGDTTQYVQAGLLSIGYFTTAWVAHTLAKYLVATEQLVAQREIDLANMAEVSQLVIQDMQDGVLVVDGHGLVRQYNARAEAMLGPLRRQQRRELNLRKYAPLLAHRLEEWRKNPVTGFDPMSTVVLNNKVSARFVPVGRSRNVGAVIFLEDASRVQAQARQMKLAALGRLTANIAHEIRNPLSAISHAAELLQEEPVVSDTVARLLAIIHDNTKRLDRMVQDVLKLNRSDRSRREAFKVGEFLQTFAGQFCQIEKVSQAMVRLELNAEPEVLFDRSHLNQVMWNLCRNALRHCSRGDASVRIVVSMVSDGNIVKLDVVDDGPGVPSALRGHLFEPFFTAASTGTGLGLYIAREICEANDATLDYVETPSGAQFTVLCRRVGSA
jgi:two-component system sensor histidine kinase PilS (NtrC family)